MAFERKAHNREALVLSLRLYLLFNGITMPVRVLGLLLMLIGVLLIFASTRRSGDQRVVALEKRYDHSGIGSSTRIWTTYDSLVVAHGE